MPKVAAALAGSIRSATILAQRLFSRQRPFPKFVDSFVGVVNSRRGPFKAGLLAKDGAIAFSKLSLFLVDGKSPYNDCLCTLHRLSTKNGP